MLRFLLVSTVNFYDFYGRHYSCSKSKNYHFGNMATERLSLNGNRRVNIRINPRRWCRLTRHSDSAGANFKYIVLICEEKKNDFLKFLSIFWLIWLKTWKLRLDEVRFWIFNFQASKTSVLLEQEFFLQWILLFKIVKNKQKVR